MATNKMSTRYRAKTYLVSCVTRDVYWQILASAKTVIKKLSAMQSLLISSEELQKISTRKLATYDL